MLIVCLMLANPQIDPSIDTISARAIVVLRESAPEEKAIGALSIMAAGTAAFKVCPSADAYENFQAQVDRWARANGLTADEATLMRQLCTLYSLGKLHGIKDAARPSLK